MRIVSWNCNMKFREKYPLVDGLDADIAVVQECENPASSAADYRDWAGKHLWTGDNPHKGLGVFWRQKHEVAEHLERRAACDAKLFLICRVNDWLDLTAVWTKPDKATGRSYTDQLRALARSLGFHAENRAQLVCGDFNSNAIWNARHRSYCHSDFVHELGASGLSSLYHHQSGEAQGNESRPTLFMGRNPNRPYHIDYAFVSDRLLATSRMIILEPANWLGLSDHVPIVVDVKPDTGLGL